MAQTVKYDGAARAKEIADQVYKEIGGRTYHRRKITNAVEVEAEEIKFKLQSHALKAQTANMKFAAAIERYTREGEELPADFDAKIDAATEALMEAKGEHEPAQRELEPQLLACFLVDDEGNTPDAEVIKSELDKDDRDRMLRDLAGIDQAPDPTKPAE